MLPQKELQRLADLDTMSQEKLEKIFPNFGGLMHMTIKQCGVLNWAATLDKANYEKLALYLQNGKAEKPGLNEWADAVFNSKPNMKMVGHRRSDGAILATMVEGEPAFGVYTIDTDNWYLGKPD